MIRRLRAFSLPDLLIAGVLASRAAYHALGIRFDATPLAYFIQYADPVLLKTRLLETLFYSHGQSPLFNLFLGLGLKAFPEENLTAGFAVCFLALGLLTATALYQLMLDLGIGRRTAFAFALVFMASPAVAIYENFLFYSSVLMACLVFAALFLNRFLRTRRSFHLFLYSSAIAALALTHAGYHLFAAIFWTLIPLARVRLPWRRAVIATGLPLLLVAGFYAKHFVLFHNLSPTFFCTGSDSVNIVLRKMPAGELDALSREGKISPYARIKPLRALELYPGLMMDEKTGIPVLDAIRKSTGAPNFMNPAYLKIARIYQNDAQAVFPRRRNYYKACLWQNVVRYFRPAYSTYLVTRSFGKTRAWALAEKWKKYAYAFPIWLGLMAAGVLAGLLVLNLGRAGLSRESALRGPVEADAFWGTAGFMVFHIAAISAGAVFFASMEQMRYRLSIDAFYWVLFALAWDRARRLLRRDGV